MQTSRVTGLAATYTVLIPILVGLRKIRLFNKTMLVFFFYFVTCLISEGVASYQMLHHMHNVITYTIFTQLQSYFFLFLFCDHLKEHLAIRWFFPFGILASSITGFFAIHAYLTKEGLEMFPHWIAPAYNLPVIALSIFLYYRFMIDMKIKRLTAHPIFWVNTSIFFYISATTICFGFDGLLASKSKVVAYIIADINVLAVLVHYGLATVAFLKYKDKQDFESPSGD